MELVLFYEAASLSGYLNEETLGARVRSLMGRMELFMGVPELTVTGVGAGSEGSEGSADSAGTAGTADSA